MALIGVLLERVLDRDGAVHEELAVHRVDCGVRRLEVVKADKAEALGNTCSRIASQALLEKGSAAADGAGMHSLRTLAVAMSEVAALSNEYQMSA